MILFLTTFTIAMPKYQGKVPYMGTSSFETLCSIILCSIRGCISGSYIVATCLKISGLFCIGAQSVKLCDLCYIMK